MEPVRIDQAETGHGEQTRVTTCQAGHIQDVLQQLRQVVGSLGPDDYTLKPVATFGGSVGGHVRHCLDHIEAVIQGIDGGVIDYDHRERGTEIESDPASALAEIDRLDSLLDALANVAPEQEVTVRVMLTGDGSVSSLRSTVGRELAFVFSHTIHHGAMIGGMVKALGGDVPEGFGLAPSTVAYRKR
jgi:uncharacterized damage-inducible protein DinB